MDTRKLPLSMLVALGLAPGCEDVGCMTQPCLDAPPVPEKKGDPDLHPCLAKLPCLSPPQDPKMTPCLSPPRDPKTAPCLDVNACLTPRPDRPSETPAPTPTPKSGGMARSDVIDRLLSSDVLPPDVAERLRDPPA